MALRTGGVSRRVPRPTPLFFDRAVFPAVDTAAFGTIGGATMRAQRSQVVEYGSGIALRQELDETLRRLTAPAGGAVDVGNAIGLDAVLVQLERHRIFAASCAR